MRPFDKLAGEITLKDIERLVENKVPESGTLDYKRDLYSSCDSDKRKFLIDVAAFANTAGGCIIVGIAENKNNGCPEEIVGVEIPGLDDLKLRFNNLLRDSACPPIRGVQYYPINYQNGKRILLIEVPQSISRPHAVRDGKGYLFYGRGDGNNNPLGIDEIRRAFIESETLALKIRNFRNDRISLISVNDILMPIAEGAKIILHLIPVSSFELGSHYNLTMLKADDVAPIGCPLGGNDSRINFDGFLAYHPYLNASQTKVESYVQLFRNGIIEAVDTICLEPKTLGGNPPAKLIPPNNRISEAVARYIQTLKKIEVNSPLWICVSFLGIKGYRTLISQYEQSTYEIDRDDLLFPEIFLEDINQFDANILNPVFDIIQQACGLKSGRVGS
jgi:hypothetical protein